MFTDYTFQITFFVMGLVVLILALRSIMFQNEIDKLHRSDKTIKEHFANEWTKCIMDEVDAKIASSITSKNAGQIKSRNGKPARKSGDSKPAL